MVHEAISVYSAVGIKGVLRIPVSGLGIEIRDQAQQAKSKSQIGFGEGWHKQQVAVHKRESEIVEKMQSLRSNGLTFRDIAKVLNSWGIQTKTRKGIWSGKQIHQVLQRKIDD